jgi:hypothetical protein
MTTQISYPGRFRAAPERNAKIGRFLRLASRVDAPDQDLLDLIGRRMLTRDELGASLAQAMDRSRPEGQRVTMAAFRTALDEGIAAVPDAPAALARFFSVIDEVPDWVDWDQVERGGRAVRRLGRTADDVLLQLSLIGGYRFGGPTELLVATGGLTGDAAMRRLGETGQWSSAVTSPGGLRRDGPGFKLTVHVRLMHALINNRFELNERWDTRQWGLPVNQSDVAATLGLFNSTLLIGARALGWIFSGEESRAVMHLWKYAGWLMGVDDDWLFATERQQNAFNYHVLIAQGSMTPAGAALSSSLVTGEAALDHGWPRALRGRYEQLRLLSMLRYFLGTRSMREFGLPVMPPWAVPPVVVKNLIRSGVIARTRGGRRYLERAGDDYRQRRARKLFGGADPGIGTLPG